MIFTDILTTKGVGHQIKMAAKEWHSRWPPHLVRHTNIGSCLFHGMEFSRGQLLFLLLAQLWRLQTALLAQLLHQKTYKEREEAVLLPQFGGLVHLL